MTGMGWFQPPGSPPQIQKERPIMRLRRTIYFNDARHYYLFVYDPPMRMEDARVPVDEVAGTSVDTFSYGVSRADGPVLPLESRAGMGLGPQAVPERLRMALLGEHAESDRARTRSPSGPHRPGAREEHGFHRQPEAGGLRRHEPGSQRRQRGSRIRPCRGRRPPACRGRRVGHELRYRSGGAGFFGRPRGLRALPQPRRSAGTGLGADGLRAGLRRRGQGAAPATRACSVRAFTRRRS